MRLRWYQQEAVDAAINTDLHNPVICMPTGSGKSVVITSLIEHIIKNEGGRVINCIHTQELVSQNHLDFINNVPDVPAGVYSAGLKSREYSQPVIFAGVQSIAKKSRIFGRVTDLIIDECHRVTLGADTLYQRLIFGLMKTNPGLRIWGFTATPWIMGVGEIWGFDGAVFDGCAYSCIETERFNRIVEDGYLCPLVLPPNIPAVDMSGVKIQGGDYNQAQSADVVDMQIAKVMPAMIDACHGRNHGMIFVPGVKNIKTVGHVLDKSGISWTFVDGKMSSERRAKNLQDFIDGKYREIINCGVLTTGFNCKTIDHIINLRATKSTPLHIQIQGRGMRVHESKVDCITLDPCGNFGRCGPVNAPIAPQRRRKGAGPAPEKRCGQCSATVHASLRQCPYCGFQFPPGDFDERKYMQAGLYSPMLGGTPIVFDTTRIVLILPRAVSATVVQDKYGLEYCRASYDHNLARLFKPKDISAWDMCSEIMEGKRASSGTGVWDFFGKYPKFTSAKYDAADFYWFPTMSEYAAEMFVDYLINDVSPTPNAISGAMRRSRIPAGVPVKQFFMQAESMRKAMSDRGIEMNLESLREYINKISNLAMERHHETKDSQ